ncbi:hypothetical protein ACJZ2D_014938 [Fusarium nematophilum]
MAGSSCNHWLWASGGDHPSVLNSGRLRKLTSTIDPQTPCPSVNILIGCHQPVNLVRKPGRQLGGIRIDLDPGTADREPLLLGTATLPSSRQSNNFRCCSPEAESVTAGSRSHMELEELIHSRLLYPFADVFCFYSYGLSDLAKISRWIATWSLHEDDSWKPSLLVVLGGKHWHQQNASTVAEELFTAAMEKLTSRPLASYFFDASFIQVPNADSLATFRPHLHRHVSVVRQRLFNPADVFHRLYWDHCIRASKVTATKERADGILLPSALTDCVLKNLITLFDRLKQGETAASVHRSTLASQWDRWPSVKSKKTCLSCLTQAPQHKLQCGHWICENCMQAFGTSDPGDPWLFVLKQCLLDGKEANLEVRIRPPTAGHCILSIDGGGVRGIIPPVILGQIQKQLDLPIPIQELFTLAYGVSAGALIVLAMFFNGWSVERCAVEFEQLAKIAFSPSPAAYLPVLNWVRSIVSDGLYSESDIEAALKKAFGEKALSDMSYAKRIGAKVGVPAASIVQPSMCLFTNYNGIGQERSGYLVLKDSENVKAWEVSGRCSSAAPLFFPPKYIPGLGTFQDGGVLQNNPIVVALAEFAAMNEGARPDLVLSIGTGSLPEAQLKDQRPRFIKDGWIVRLKRGYMSLMQGKKTWHDVVNVSRQTEVRNGDYRLDITLDQPPSLDDTTTMSMLTSLVGDDTPLRKAIPAIAYHLFATMFYFELDSLPTRAGGNFRVSGRILCIRKGNDPALPKIRERLGKSKFLINGKPVPPSISMDAHNNIYQRVNFTTGKAVLIELKEGGSRHAFPLSGAPYNIPKLIACGHMTAVFGTRSHEKRPLYEPCRRPSKRRKHCLACFADE